MKIVYKIGNGFHKHVRRKKKKEEKMFLGPLNGIININTLWSDKAEIQFQ